MTTLFRRRRFAALVAAGLVVALVFAATGLGFRLPGLGFLELFGDRTNLDYDSRYVEGFSPLREAFVNERLGPPGRLGPGFNAVGAGSSSSVASHVTVDHPATNDDFANAYELHSVPVTARTKTTNATRETGEPGGCSPVGGTVWYRYTPSRKVTLIADTFGTKYSDSLAVFTGSKLSDLDSIGCEKSATGNSQVTVSARPGVRYYFQITGVAQGGALTFNLQPLGKTTQVDALSDGESASSPVADVHAVSNDGRFVAFVSSATNLGCTSSCLFVRDLSSRRPTMLVETGRSDDGSNYYLGEIDISGDGRYVSFVSSDPTLVSGDSNNEGDAFVVDRVTRRVERVSVTSTGAEARFDPTKNAGTTQGTPILVGPGTHSTAISSDGRYVAFASDAVNLSSRATEGYINFYIHDRKTGRTDLASADEHGDPVPGSNGNRLGRGISGDGRIVVFWNNPVCPPPYTSSSCDAGGVYVRDRLRNTTKRIAPGTLPVVSDDGRRVAFSRAQGDGTYVYVYDVPKRKLIAASVSSDGTTQGSPSENNLVLPGTCTYHRVSLSADGRYVAFDSAAPNLTPHDTNAVNDVVVRDLVNGTTVLVSIRSDGSQLSADSCYASISGDGRVIVFQNDLSDQHVFAHVSAVAGRP